MSTPARVRVEVDAFEILPVAEVAAHDFPEYLDRREARREWLGLIDHADCEDCSDLADEMDLPAWARKALGLPPLVLATS